MRNCTTDAYWAFVRFDVRAAHFRPVYEFRGYAAASKREVAGQIADDFEEKVDEEIGRLGSVEEETEEDRSYLADHFKACLSRIENESADAPVALAELEMGVYLGYPTSSFEVLADGPWKRFLGDCLAALDREENISSFFDGEQSEAECWENGEAVDEEHGSAERKLYRMYCRLKSADPEQVRPEDFGEFLEGIRELIFNDTM